MPPVYELMLGFWRWCKLSEICAVVPGVARIAGNDFAPSPEVLVQRFAALVRPNIIPPHIEGAGKESKAKKIFRYSLTGGELYGPEVPLSEHGQSLPPYRPFALGVGTPYPNGLFVPEGWAIDTLKAIRLGAIAAADFGDVKIGFSPREKGGSFRL
ncbi:MAG TPA: hypothetical protein VMR99_02385 [Candidatus Paceibacterota bacterium]|nr:hypothetical protein [Candidatus Paceibacterota bacterium]